MSAYPAWIANYKIVARCAWGTGPHHGLRSEKFGYVYDKPIYNDFPVTSGALSKPTGIRYILVNGGALPENQCTGSPVRCCCAAIRWSAREKICRVTVPGIPTCPVPRAMALVNHPGITAVEHLVQVTRPRTLDGEGFAFDNTVIRRRRCSTPTGTENPESSRPQDIGKTRHAWFHRAEDIGPVTPSSPSVTISGVRRVGEYHDCALPEEHYLSCSRYSVRLSCTSRSVK
jgi:hypothetical protein